MVRVMATQATVIRHALSAMPMHPPSLVELQLPVLVAFDVLIALIPRVLYQVEPLGVILKSIRAPFANGVVMAMEK